MIKSFFCCLLLAIGVLGHAQKVVLQNVDSNIYIGTCHNEEMEDMDTFLLHLMANHNFVLERKGRETFGEHMVGSWTLKDKLLTLHNEYPSDRPLPVTVYKLSKCDSILPVIANSKGEVLRSVFLDADHYSFLPGDIVTYLELDSLRQKVRICTIGGQLCSNIFSIPYRDCYGLIVPIDISLSGYNSHIKTLYFNKTEGRLTFLRADVVNSK